MSRWRNRELGRKQLWQTSAKRRKHRLEPAPWSKRIDETRVHVLKPETMSSCGTDLSHDRDISRPRWKLEERARLATVLGVPQWDRSTYSTNERFAVISCRANEKEKEEKREQKTGENRHNGSLSSKLLRTNFNLCRLAPLPFFPLLLPLLLFFFPERESEISTFR